MAKTRVLFVCIGNACRSPMAEGFARAHGSDVIEAQSAGLAPALAVVPMTHHVMLEKKVSVGNCYPKELGHIAGDIDLIVNMSGYPLPASYPLLARSSAQVEVWNVQDPVGESEAVFRQVRDEIEQHVLDLIARLRSRKPAASQELAAPPAATKVDTRRRPTRQ